MIIKKGCRLFLKKDSRYLKGHDNYTMESKNELAKQVVSHMMEHDFFSQWLGIEVLGISEGYSRIKMIVRNEMVNGFGIVHGGIAFSLADSAFAFACNNRNILSVALDTSINFIKPVNVGDELTAEAKEIHNGKSTGLYHIRITNQHGSDVAIFKGLCYRTDKSLINK
jgi:acyl-CoA thioesterase